MKVNINPTNGDAVIELTGQEGGYLSAVMQALGQSTAMLELCPEMADLARLLSLSYSYATDTNYEQLAMKEMVERSKKFEAFASQLKEVMGMTDEQAEDEVEDDTIFDTANKFPAC